MIREGVVIGTFVGFVFAVLLVIIVEASGSGGQQNETDPLRFCMTHSIPLEQCEIPEKGE